MISYEVTVTVDPPLEASFDDYMTKTHIPEVMATGCFVTAQYYAADGRRRTIYLAPSQETLDRYLNSHAASLRDDFATRFPAGVAVSREIWQLKGTF